MLQAVIGAGAAGLVSIRELLKEGHQVTGFEQGAKPGGVWRYDAAADSDPLGAQRSRRKVHGSMYRCASNSNLRGGGGVPWQHVIGGG
jgi:cation diffusion facilitator CzcD-associated flavoprotein CzcO